jgi:hypothetical protein
MREIVIKPKVEEKPTPVIISHRQKLYDAEAALEAAKDIVIPDVISKASDELLKEEPALEPKIETPVPEPIPDPPKVLYDPEQALKDPKAVIFSWQKDEKKKEPKVDEKILEQKSVEELKVEAKPVADEFVEKVVVVETKKKTVAQKVAKGAGDTIVLAFFVISVLLGGKTAFDYVQEAESFKRIAGQLEAMYPSDLPPSQVQSLGKFGQGSLLEPPTDINVDRLSGDAFTNIIEVKPYYLLAKRRDGKIELRTGGSVGWRTNNPGKFGYGDFAKKTGAVGEYSKYAIYPSEKEGMQALEVYLFSTNLYNNLTIQNAMQKFYADDKEDAEEVAKQISVDLNLSRHRTTLSSLNNQQKITMLKTIGEHERNLKGVVRVYDSMEEFREKGF